MRLLSLVCKFLGFHGKILNTHSLVQGLYETEKLFPISVLKTQNFLQAGVR